MTPTPEQIKRLRENHITWRDSINRCEEAAQIIEKQATEIAELKDDLQFVERWAVHHGTKPHITAEQALSLIQHYPPITAITKSYVDGKVPDTFNPYAEIAELKAKLAEVMPLAKFGAEVANHVDGMGAVSSVAIWRIATRVGVLTPDQTEYAPNIGSTIEQLLKD